MRRAPLFFLASLVPLAAIAESCTDFKKSDGAIDSGIELDSGASDSAVGPNATKDSGTSDADAGSLVPPTDVVCTEPWNQATKTDPNCAQRSVTLIEPGVIMADGLTVAHDSAGRVALAYAGQLPEEEDFHVSTFVPTTSTFKISLAVETEGFGVHFGHASSIAADPTQDLFHVVYSDLEDAEIHYVQLAAAATTFSTDELVATGIDMDTHVSIAVSPANNIHVGYYAPGSSGDGGAPGHVAAVQRNAAGGFGTPVNIGSGIAADGAPGVGNLSLAFDSSGAPNLIFQACPFANESQPVSATFAGSMWSFPKTIDNPTFDGFAGISVSLAIFGQAKYAVYFVRKAAQADPTAELHLATWVLDADIPQITVLETGIPAPDPGVGEPFDFRLSTSIAVDKYGLLHVAVIHPTTDPSSGMLEYLRQTVSGGQTKWLSDIVDPNVLSAQSQGLVGIAVDENARPHIGYHSGNDLNVYYATRYDR